MNRMSESDRTFMGGEPVLDPATAGVKLPDSELEKVLRDIAVSEPVGCPACGGASFRLIARRDRYGFPLNYVACEHCGLVFANPYYDSASLDRFYVRHYARVYGRNASVENMFHAECVRGRRVARLLKDFTRTNGARLSSCLDLGCAHGGFLASLPREWLRVGYDYDTALFALGLRSGLELRSIDQLAAERRTFDVVMANQVLEHTPDALEFLRKMRTFLAPGGVIYIEVPGLRSPAAAHIDVRLTFKNAHHYLFESRTLRWCAARAGLRAVYLNESVEALLVADDGAMQSEPPPLDAARAAHHRRVRDSNR